MSTFTYTIGIDPGISGAFCVYNNETNKIVQLQDMPIIANGKGNSSVKSVVEPVELYKLLAPYADKMVMAHLERVASRPGNSLTSCFSLGDSFGCIRTVLACHGIPVTYLTPQAWKKYYNIPAKSDKEYSRALALQLCPDADLIRKKDHNRAEAILLAKMQII